MTGKRGGGAFFGPTFGAAFWNWVLMIWMKRGPRTRKVSVVLSFTITEEIYFTRNNMNSCIFNSALPYDPISSPGTAVATCMKCQPPYSVADGRKAMATIPTAEY